MRWKQALFGPVLIWYATNPYLSPDSYWYLVSAEAIKTGGWREDYVWNRTPGYPFFIALISIVSEKNLLVVVSMIQITLLCLVLIKLRDEIIKSFSSPAERISMKRSLNCSLGVSFVLLGGYSSALLPQALIAVILTWQAIYLLKISNTALFGLHQMLELVALTLISYLVHPILAGTVVTAFWIFLIKMLISTREAKRRSTLNCAAAMIIGVFMLCALHVVWSQIATEEAAIQSKLRIEQITSKYKSESPQNNLWKSAIISDPLFKVSVLQPILNDPEKVVFNFPKLFISNVIGAPSSGPNVSIGFYRMFSGIEQCVVAPTSVVLSISPGLLRNIGYECRIPSGNLSSSLLRLIAKSGYLMSWIIGLSLLFKFFIQIVRRKSTLRFSFIVPAIFVGIYAALQANENRYGAPALPLMLMFGSVWSRNYPGKTAGSKRVPL